MKETFKRALGMKATLAITLSASLIAGCSSTPEKEGSSQSSAQTSSDTATPFTLSYWVTVPAAAAKSIKSFNDMLLYQELEKRTGVKVSFQHPAIGSNNEQFNLLIASGNLPDVIEYNFTNYPGGPEKAVSDKVIIPLNDLIDKNAPHLKKFLNEHPDIKKDISTDKGEIYVFPAVGVGHSEVSSGMILRKDWLQELGLKAPETIDEWTTVLRTFKEKKGAKTPLTMNLADFKQDRFNGAYGVSTSFYLNDGKVKYGPYEQAYKNYLMQLNAWYKEGLLDVDFATQDGKAMSAKIANGSAGAFVGLVGGTIGSLLNAIPENNKSFDLVGAQHPVLQKGQEPNIFLAAFPYRGDGSAAITHANKNPAQTAKWLDYFYSDEGNMLKSFGVEGVTFNNENGFPKYTDLITNNPDKLSISDAMSKYLRVANPSPGFVGDDRYTEQYYKLSQQKEAIATFNKYYKNLEKTRLPRIKQTTEEAQELSSIMAEVETYKEEMFLKFVMGAEPFDKYGDYINRLKSLKIERAIELKQAAMNRYNSQK